MSVDTKKHARFFPTFQDGTRRRSNPHRAAFRKVENMNWHFQNDGALKGLKVMHPVGGGVSHFWNYIAKCWEYYGYQSGEC